MRKEINKSSELVKGRLYSDVKERSDEVVLEFVKSDKNTDYFRHNRGDSCYIEEEGLIKFGKNNTWWELPNE